MDVEVQGGMMLLMGGDAEGDEQTGECNPTAGLCA